MNQHKHRIVLGRKRRRGPNYPLRIGVVVFLLLVWAVHYLLTSGVHP